MKKKDTKKPKPKQILDILKEKENVKKSQQQILDILKDKGICITGEKAVIHIVFGDVTIQRAEGADGASSSSNVGANSFSSVEVS